MNPHAVSRFKPARTINVALFVCLLTLAHAAGQTPTNAPDPVEGKWYGMTGFPQDRVEVGFEFKRNEKGELKAYLYQPVINFYGLELPGTLNKVGDKYVHEDMRMSLTLHDGKLEGTFKRKEKGELKAYLYQPVINFYGLELPGTLNKVGDKYVHEDMRMSLTLHD